MTVWTIGHGTRSTDELVSVDRLDALRVERDFRILLRAAPRNVAMPMWLTANGMHSKFLAAAEAFAVAPAASGVFEDAESGVEVGRTGGFGWVVGFDRAGNAAGLRERGADRLVPDLAELLVEP